MSDAERPDRRDRSDGPDPDAAAPCGPSWRPPSADYATAPGGGSGWAEPLPGPVAAEALRVPPAYRVWAPTRGAARD